MKKRKIALLHLLLEAGDVSYNQRLIEKAVLQAADKNVDWIVTPELAVSGLQFNHIIGTDWISKQPDEWMIKLSNRFQRKKVTLFLGCAEKGEQEKLYNSVFVINSSGEIIGKQRKIARVDNWSASGNSLEPIDLGEIKVGISICADAYTKAIADTLWKKGAEILIAPSSWGPGLHGPEGEWEARSFETGLPIFVCNRTGEDKSVTFWEAESLVIKNGKRLLSYKSSKSSILTFDWDVEKMELISPTFDVDFIE